MRSIEIWFWAFHDILRIFMWLPLNYQLFKVRLWQRHTEYSESLALISFYSWKGDIVFINSTTVLLATMWDAKVLIYFKYIEILLIKYWKHQLNLK